MRGSSISTITVDETDCQVKLEENWRIIHETKRNDTLRCEVMRYDLKQDDAMRYDYEPL